jgi:hypothetical protein
LREHSVEQLTKPAFPTARQHEAKYNARVTAIERTRVGGGRFAKCRGATLSAGRFTHRPAAAHQDEERPEPSCQEDLSHQAKSVVARPHGLEQARTTKNTPERVSLSAEDGLPSPISRPFSVPGHRTPTRERDGPMAQASVPKAPSSA